MKKYEFVENDVIVLDDNTTLRRIRALVEIEYLCKPGDLGGYIEKEENLSHEGKCWVYGNAWVHGNARITDNVHVFDRAVVCGNVKMSGHSSAFNNAHLSGNVQLIDASVSNNARVSGNVVLDGAAIVDNATIAGHVTIRPGVIISYRAHITKQSDIVCMQVGTSNLAIYKTTNGLGFNYYSFAGNLKKFVKAVNEGIYCENTERFLEFIKQAKQTIK